MRIYSAAIGVLLASLVPTLAIAQPAGTPGTAAAAFEGPVWRLVQIGGKDDAKIAGLPEAVTVRFQGGRLQGFGGCNQLAGSYRLEGERLTIDAIAGTMMACPPPAMGIETAFKAALSGVLIARVVDDRLTLAAESDPAPRLVFDRAPVPRLEGTRWEVNGFNNGRQAVISPVVGTVLSLSFENGAIVGHAGCNSFRASYTLAGDHITVGPAAATRKFCDGKGVMQQEHEFLAALASATTWTIERGMLDLHRPDGERVVLAHPAKL